MESSHGRTAAARPIHAPVSPSYAGPFGRIFRNLAAWEPQGDDDAAKIADIERIALEMVDPNDGDPARNNQAIPAGYTYFGQFVDHDITFDPRSSLQKAMDPENLENFRTPAFDLDCLYGRGPDDQPYLYEDGKRFLIGTNGVDEDLPRNTSGVALIGDKRNDENTFISQLQLVFLKFHNVVLEDIANGNFDEAHRVVRWHYQWVVVHDWLKRLCGADRVDHILNLAPSASDRGKPRLRFYGYEAYPFMPVEFSVAAYRLGHSMIRGRYKINTTVPALPTFSMSADNDPPEDFRGFRPLPQQWTIEWSRFFDFDGQPGVDPANRQHSRNIDRFLANPVIEMPDQIAPPVTPAPQSVARSLAFRNLLRSWRLGLPSGQAVANRICAPIPKQLSNGPELPLWRYILDEADAVHQGKMLGDVGATIVAETFIGLLAADPSSFYRVSPCWTPEIPKAGKTFELRDIIKFSKAKIA